MKRDKISDKEEERKRGMVKKTGSGRGTAMKRKRNEIIKKVMMERRGKKEEGHVKVEKEKDAEGDDEKEKRKKKEGRM